MQITEQINWFVVNEEKQGKGSSSDSTVLVKINKFGKN
jgi:hypothetical protein